MKSVVVYESHWGNTAAVAHAIAEGLGPDTAVLTTDAATKDVLADADLVVAGAPVIAFGLASDRAREGLAKDAGRAPSPPDVSHPAMRTWLAGLPVGTAHAAAFETRIWWSPWGATSTIEGGLRKAGYRTGIAKAGRFVVEDTYGPLREGELERARAWGAGLAAAAARTR